MIAGPEDLGRDPNPLAADYSRFRVGERLLLTGHSHQAWPDVALGGQVRAWTDAALHVDAKWEHAAAMAESVKGGYAARLGDDDPSLYALGANTHELVVRFLSALPLAARPRLVTTDGEFHSLRRQLDRLAEAGLEVVKVAAEPGDDLAARLAAAVDDRAAAVLVSAVMFQTARIVHDLGTVARAASRHGAELLVDAYHAVNVVPFDLAAEGLEGAYVVGGGYKYCQLGEGNAFLRVPPGCALRPVVTGWFAEFADLASEGAGGVAYGRGGARFDGATYDPTSHYRAAAVFDYFAARRLDVPLLRATSQRQVSLLAAAVDALDADPRLLRRLDQPLADTGGFLVLVSPRAGELSTALAARGVATDFRGDRLRLGPAPYLSDRQLRDAVTALGEVVGA